MPLKLSLFDTHRQYLGDKELKANTLAEAIPEVKQTFIQQDLNLSAVIVYDGDDFQARYTVEQFVHDTIKP